MYVEHRQTGTDTQAQTDRHRQRHTQTHTDTHTAVLDRSLQADSERTWCLHQASDELLANSCGLGQARRAALRRRPLALLRQEMHQKPPHNSLHGELLESLLVEGCGAPCHLDQGQPIPLTAVTGTADLGGTRERERDVERGRKRGRERFRERSRERSRESVCMCARVHACMYALRGRSWTCKRESRRAYLGCRDKVGKVRFLHWMLEH